MLSNVFMNFWGNVKFYICTAWELGKAEDGEDMSNIEMVKFWE